MIDTVIFDFDNTLEQWTVPEAEAEVAIVDELSKMYDFNADDFRKKLREIHKGPREKKRSETTPWDWSRENWFQQLFNEFNIDEDPVKYERKYWNLVNSRISLFPNVKKTLDQLKKMGLKLMILSDSDGKRKFKEERIMLLGIWNYFDYVFSTDDVGVNKPNMRVYDYIIETTGLKPEKTLVVGDHPESDLVTAKKLGMVTVWDQEAFAFDRTLKFVDFTVKDIFEVVGIISRLNRR